MGFGRHHDTRSEGMSCRASTNCALCAAPSCVMQQAGLKRDPKEHIRAADL